MQKDQTIPDTNPPTELPTDVSSGLLAEQRERPPELQQLNVFIGRWMTEGETVAESGAAAVSIVASDVYQWLTRRILRDAPCLWPHRRSRSWRG
jgi:hypothetical protein